MYQQIYFYHNTPKPVETYHPTVPQGQFHSNCPKVPLTCNRLIFPPNSESFWWATTWSQQDNPAEGIEQNVVFPGIRPRNDEPVLVTRIKERQRNKDNWEPWGPQPLETRPSGATRSKTIIQNRPAWLKAPRSLTSFPGQLSFRRIAFSFTNVEEMFDEEARKGQRSFGHSLRSAISCQRKAPSIYTQLFFLVSTLTQTWQISDTGQKWDSITCITKTKLPRLQADTRIQLRGLQTKQRSCPSHKHTDP